MEREEKVKKNYKKNSTNVWIAISIYLYIIVRARYHLLHSLRLFCLICFLIYPCKHKHTIIIIMDTKTEDTQKSSFDSSMFFSSIFQFLAV